MTDLTELLARVEKAEGPDRELDCALALAIGGYWLEAQEHRGDAYVYRDKGGTIIRPGYGGDQLVPAYSRGLDEALALVERVLPGWTWDIGCDANLSGRFFTAILWTPDAKNDTGECQSDASPALALLAALLRALIAQQEGG